MNLISLKFGTDIRFPSYNHLFGFYFCYDCDASVSCCCCTLVLKTPSYLKNPKKRKCNSCFTVVENAVDRQLQQSLQELNWQSNGKKRRTHQKAYSVFLFISQQSTMEIIGLDCNCVWLLGQQWPWFSPRQSICNFNFAFSNCHGFHQGTQPGNFESCMQ